MRASLSFVGYAVRRCWRLEGSTDSVHCHNFDFTKMHIVCRRMELSRSMEKVGRSCALASFCGQKSRPPQFQFFSAKHIPSQASFDQLATLPDRWTNL